MELSEKWLRRLIVGLLVVSVTLQVAAIVMPGWMIRVQNSDDEVYTGLFYAQRCFRVAGGISETCEVKSLADWHSLDRDMGDVAVATKDFAFHHELKKQVFAIVALAASLLTAVSEGCTLREYISLHPRRTAVGAATSAFSAALIISVLSDSFIEISYWVDVTVPDGTYVKPYVGVPYSVILYAMALVMSCLATGFLTLHASRLAGRVKGPRLSLPLCRSEDNPVFTEKM